MRASNRIPLFVAVTLGWAVLFFSKESRSYAFSTTTVEELVAAHLAAPYDGSVKSRRDLQLLKERTDKFLKTNGKLSDTKAERFLISSQERMARFLEIGSTFDSCRGGAIAKSSVARKVLAGAAASVSACEMSERDQFRSIESLQDDLKMISAQLEKAENPPLAQMRKFAFSLTDRAILDTLKRQWTHNRLFLPSAAGCEADVGRTEFAAFKSIVERECQIFKASAGKKTASQYIVQRGGNIVTAHDKIASDFKKRLTELNETIEDLNRRSYSSPDEAMKAMSLFRDQYNAMIGTKIGSLANTQSLAGVIPSARSFKGSYVNGKLQIAKYPTEIREDVIKSAVYRDVQARTQADLAELLKLRKSYELGNYRDDRMFATHFREIFPTFLTKYPKALGKSLYDFPQYAGFVCARADASLGAEEFQDQFLSAAEGAAMGAAALGFAAGTGGAGLIALAGLGGAGATITKASLASARIDDERELQLLSARDPQFKRFSARISRATEEFHERLQEAVIAGALAPLDAVALYRLASDAWRLQNFASKVDMSWEQVTKYLEDVASGAKNPKELLSLAHQTDLVEAIRNPALQAALERNGFKVNKFFYGALDSDVGKIGDQWAAALTKTQENLQFASFLKASPETESGQALRELLDRMGFKGKSLLNPDLKNDEVLDLLAKPSNGALKGFLHEFPGMKNAVKDYEAGRITKAEFQDRLEANLFHNGPHAGFWGFFTENLLPKLSENNIELMKGSVFYKGTKTVEVVGKDGAKSSRVVADLYYPSPKCFECLTHTFFDRMSQGSAGGVKKIYVELGATMSPLAKAKEMLTGNQSGTLQQIEALQAHTAQLRDLTQGQKKLLEDLYDAGRSRLGQLQGYVRQNVKFADTGITLRYTDSSGNPVTRFLSGAESDANVMKTLEEFVAAEERTNGVAVQALTLKVAKRLPPPPPVNYSSIRNDGSDGLEE